MLLLLWIPLIFISIMSVMFTMTSKANVLVGLTTLMVYTHTITFHCSRLYQMIQTRIFLSVSWNMKSCIYWVFEGFICVFPDQDYNWIKFYPNPIHWVVLIVSGQFSLSSQIEKIELWIHWWNREDNQHIGLIMSIAAACLSYRALPES